eukprot:CAMPEP_0176388748 /NCGR_PEP_ID=MMETSP0126-20121128/37816_1 /TAXON_ID=141414 ORGANISM="Strombidinopsis acuminatum, Strain SPMC142" /NCGR_SAMPLE_ID=MMETSP0126 /ASSEMBLY_ACC=CAM_ASM_000229 /LENGTH=50 /DNA_ID=CAMNT_0017757131 /DNA_START=747 /DNA_END=896 /DNA_ORIENTATION=-
MEARQKNGGKTVQQMNESMNKSMKDTTMMMQLEASMKKKLEDDDSLNSSK